MQTVKHLLERKSAEVISVGPGDSVLTAIKLMAERHVGALLVMREWQAEPQAERELLGVISERDYARKVILKGRSSHDTPVSEIMSSPVISVSPSDTVHRCMQIMTDKRIRHLPVVREGRVVGVLSIGDLVKAMIDEQREEIEQLQRYIAGS
ncbi:MAG: CBS domain-containing protein [Proteobacteria bacterium]|nr:CBS domain-containing protein [Pseudomonadota bacterium]